MYMFCPQTVGSLEFTIRVVMGLWDYQVTVLCNDITKKRVHFISDFQLILMTTKEKRKLELNLTYLSALV